MKAPKASEPPVPTFAPDEWTPLNPDAFTRIIASVGDPTLAASRFHQDALAGRLEMGLVEILPDGKVVEKLLTTVGLETMDRALEAGFHTHGGGDHSRQRD